MIDSTFVAKVAELSQVQEFVVDEKTFTSKQVYEVKPEPKKLVSIFSVVSLAGFAELVRQKLDVLKDSSVRYAIHVKDHLTVNLVSLDTDEHGRRQLLAGATPVPFEGFKFGAYLDHESFVIGVASKFSGTPDRDYVIDVASSITSGAARTSEDDGLQQTVAVQRGMKLKGNVAVRNRVELAPFRTFPEVGQPISPFLFRLKGDADNETPTLALFDADGGKWKLAAIQEIQKYIEKLNLGLPIVA